MNVWRLCKQRYCATAFSGEGASITGGRWNPSGVPMVYTSSSLSLAILEVFVHLDIHEEPADFVRVLAEPLNPVDFELNKQAVLKMLPADWKTLSNPVLQKFGADWAASMRSLTLPVPSVVVDGEWNVLINPRHPDAGRIKTEPPVPFHFDKRLFR